MNSYYSYSFDLKSINSINEYLFILKNCLRLASKNKLYNNTFNKRIHISYCNVTNKYYYKVNNSNIKTDISCDLSIVYSFNLKKQLDVLKLNKYSNRTIEFEIDKDNKLYPITLYNSNTKKIILAYSDLFSYFVNVNNSIRKLNLQINIENYQKLYYKFIEYIENIKILKDINSIKYTNLTKKSSDVRMDYLDFDKAYKMKLFPLKKHRFYYTVFLISIEFNNFLRDNLDIPVSNFCIFDNSIGKIIKFPCSFYNNVYKENTKKHLPPLLPVRF
jgi:hypothetical protein